MDIKNKLKSNKIIKAIRKCALNPDKVRVTDRARASMVSLRFTKNEVCEAIVDWIDAKKAIEQDISYHEIYAGQKLYIMKPKIGEAQRYVKVSLLENDGKFYIMRIVSAHENNGEGAGK
ncbi:MAG TPA: hypothetical protein PLN69_07080 [bacterium]|nr:hypothetical protein [bacterium]